MLGDVAEIVSRLVGGNPGVSFSLARAESEEVSLGEVSLGEVR